VKFHQIGSGTSNITQFPKGIDKVINRKFSLKNIIIKYSIILLLVELTSWWILFYSPFNIPTHIARTPINISGLFLLLTLSIIIVLSQRDTIKIKKSVTLIHLIAVGGLVTFFAELAFQAIRFPTLVAETLSEKFYFASRGIFAITLISIVISIITGTILKQKNKKAEQERFN
jgi:hypothetical protein